MGSLTGARENVKKAETTPKEDKKDTPLTNGKKSEKARAIQIENYSKGLRKQVQKYGKTIEIDAMQEIVDLFLDTEFIDIFLTLSDHYKRTYMNIKRLDSDSIAPKLAGITDKRNRKIFRIEGDVLIKAEKYGVKIDGIDAIKKARKKLWELYNSKIN